MIACMHSHYADILRSTGMNVYIIANNIFWREHG